MAFSPVSRRLVRLLEADDPQDHPDDGDEGAEPDRVEDQLFELLEGQSISSPDLADRATRR